MYFSYKEMGNRIVQKRRELRISQKQLAEKLSISNNHLSNIENGKYPINIKTLYKLAEFYKVDMKYFF